MTEHRLTDRQRNNAIIACLDRFVEDYGWRILFESIAQVAESRCSRTAFEAATSAASTFAAHEKRPEQLPRPVRFARFR